jgi:peptidyl-prolyl cis-trans isomerase D
MKVGDHYQDFADLEPKLKRAVSQQKKLDFVIDMAKKFIEDNTVENYLSVAGTEGLTVVDGKGVTAVNSIPGIRKDLVINEAILALQPGDNTGLVEGEYAAYIAFVTNRDDPDMEKFELEKDALFETTLQTKKDEYLNTWYQELIENAQIVDNRKMFF